MTFRSIRNPGSKPETLAGLDNTLEMLYAYDNHDGTIQPIDAYDVQRTLEKMGGIARE